MTPIDPTKKTTLVLTAAFQPIGFFSARSTIRNLIVENVKAVDSEGNMYSWREWNLKTDFSENHPSLRSPASEFPVPTIVTIPGFYSNYKTVKTGGKRTSSLRQLFNLYEKTCQYCLKEIPYHQATKDHTLPKSKGGGNSDDNIVLACKKCNNKKASRFPFQNIKGLDVIPKILSEVEFLIKAEKIPLRPEWEQFIDYK